MRVTVQYLDGITLHLEVSTQPIVKGGWMTMVDTDGAVWAISPHAARAVLVEDE